MSKSYIDGLCYPGSDVGKNQHPKGLVNVGLTQASKIHGHYPHGSGERPMSNESMLPHGASKRHGHSKQEKVY